MPVKVDVYGTTADGKGMIGKNVAASFFSTEQYYNDKANYLTNSAYKPLSDSGFAFLDPVNPNKVDIYSKVNFQNGVDNNLVPDGRANNGTFGRTNLLDLIPSTDDSKGSWVITDNAIDNGAAGSKN